MSEPENFIARWSRRKTAAQDAVARPAAAPAAAPPPPHGGEGERKESDAAPALGGTREPSAPAFDPTTLPSIERITAETDIRAFLAPGVPAHLTRAALRRAWASDPKIRDFVGLSENSWDFNAPDAIAGFGPLEMTDELRGPIARMLGGGGAGEAPSTAPAQGRQEPASSPEGSSELADAPPGDVTPDVASTAAPPLDASAGKPSEQARAAPLPHRNR